jgi:hypothetical protein
VEATATETASACNWSSPAAPAADTATTAEASSHSSSSAVLATSLRLPDQGRTRKQRDPIEFSFHDFGFFCVLFVLLNHLVNWISEARNRDCGSHFAFLLQCVPRLETLDDIDNTAPSHKFSDGGADSLRLAWHHRDFFREIFFGFHRYSLSLLKFQNVYGRRSTNLTIHISESRLMILGFGEPVWR